MKNKSQGFMSGRYGMDTLGRVITGAGMLLLVVSIFIPSSTLDILVLAVIFFIYSRMFSKDYEKRAKENQWFLEKLGKFKSFFVKNKSNSPSTETQSTKSKTQTAKEDTYRYFKCPSCGQKTRVPKGKGKISIICPTCRHEFMRKS